MISEVFKPDLFSKVVREVVAPLWAWKEKSPYLRHLRQLEQSHLQPLDHVHANQWQRFIKLLQHAYKNTNFYATRLKALGLEPDDFKGWNDLRQLPLLSKDEIRTNKMEMVARNIPPDKLIPGKTSGSSGVSLEFFIDEDSQQWKRACTVYYDQWSGWKLGEKIGAIWGNPPLRNTWRNVLRNNLLERFIYLDTLKMDEEDMSEFYYKLLKQKPTLLFGHAHSLYLFANFLRSQNLLNIRPRGIISTCMVLHDYERKLIEKVFQCRVTNRYGCEEVSLIACECPEGNMHLNYNNLIVEFIRNGQPVQSEDPGAIVVTDLSNFGMPFIRYLVGDIGIPSSNDSCPCGCVFPIVKAIEGRVADFVMTPDGKYISGISLTENFALQIPDVKQMQIVQERIDLLVFRIVKGEKYNEKTIDEINRLVQERFGPNMHYELEYVETIQSEDSGKYRFCISKIPSPFF